DFHVTGVQTCALPICMVSDGHLNDLVNAGKSDINVVAVGQWSEAAGMVAIGHGNELENEDKSDINVVAVGQWSEAAGLVAIGHEIGRASCREGEERRG